MLVNHGLLPLLAVFIEPAKILFLNNAINHGILSPIGAEQAAIMGRSIMYMPESNPGPGVLLAYCLFSRDVKARRSAPGAVIIHFFGGIHEIYFPYVLSNPKLIVAPIAGSAAAVAWFSMTGCGLVAPASPGSIIAYLSMTPVAYMLPTIAGVAISAGVSFAVAAPMLRATAPAAADEAAEDLRSQLGTAEAVVISNTEDAAIVVCQRILSERARSSAPQTQIAVIDNFLDGPAPVASRPRRGILTPNTAGTRREGRAMEQDTDKRVALVLEGGGMRGMFTAGVLDVFLEQGFRGFSHIYGVSAGAINGANFKAGQVGRFCRDTLAARDNPAFMSLRSLALTGNVTGREFLYDTVNTRMDPFDCAAFNADPVPFTVVASDLTFGTAAYLEVADLPAQMDAVMASSSLPCLSEVVAYDGRRLLDGGTCDSVPVERALADGADELVVVLTQHRGYRKSEAYSLMGVARRLYGDYPYYLEALETRGARYNAQLDHVFELEAEGVAHVVAPSAPVELALMEEDGTKLLELYVDGRRMAAALLQSLGWEGNPTFH